MIYNSDLYPLVKYYTVCPDNVIICAFAERWHPETNTFHLPFGEMIITLDDVYYITHLPILGKSVRTTSAVTVDECIALLVDGLGTDSKKTKAHCKKHEKSVEMRFIKDHCCRQVTNVDSLEMKQQVCRGYFLFLLDMTPFADKSGTRVHIEYLKMLMEVADVSKYTWGVTSLALMFRQLGSASREGTRRIAGYLPILEAWIYDHFRLWGNAKQSWDARLPTIAKWEPPHFIGVLDEQITTLTELLDDLSPEEVFGDPYVESKRNTPLHAITWFTGSLLCLDIEESYHPDRVMRQMRNVQIITVHPIQAKMNNRVRFDKHYFVQYEVLASFTRR